MTKSKSWPLKADYRKLTLADGIKLVNVYISIRGLESLRKHWEFRNSDDILLYPEGYCRHSLWCALQVVVDEVNAVSDDDRMAKLADQLSKHLGPLDKPIAVTLLGRGTARDSYTIYPQIWSHATRY